MVERTLERQFLILSEAICDCEFIALLEIARKTLLYYVEAEQHNPYLLRSESWRHLHRLFPSFPRISCNGAPSGPPTTTARTVSSSRILRSCAMPVTYCRPSPGNLAGSVCS